MFLFTGSRPALGPTHSLIQLVPGALSPGVKQQGREADHSPPAIPPLSSHMSSWCSAHRDSFTFTITIYEVFEINKFSVARVRCSANMQLNFIVLSLALTSVKR
jgi:hypothetical protein